MWRRVTGISVTVLVLSVLGFIGGISWHALGGDYAKYGRVDIPGSGTVQLPEGRVDVAYDVQLPTSDSGGYLTVPRLSFDIEPPDGKTYPDVHEDWGSSISVNNDSHERVWRMQVPKAGAYSVTTDGDVGGFIDPQLAFGTSSTAPTWPIFVCAALFFVSLGLLVVSGIAANRTPKQPRSQKHPRPVVPSSTPVPSTVTTPVTAPVANTPEQEMARLTQLQQLSDLHTAGTLSDEEYQAARARLGG